MCGVPNWVHNSEAALWMRLEFRFVFLSAAIEIRFDWFQQSMFKFWIDTIAQSLSTTVFFTWRAVFTGTWIESRQWTKMHVQVYWPNCKIGSSRAHEFHRQKCKQVMNGFGHAQNVVEYVVEYVNLSRRMFTCAMRHAPCHVIDMEL